MRSRGKFFLALALVALTALSACGKKPGSVDPPVGIDPHSYPRVYPNPATDPSP